MILPENKRSEIKYLIQDAIRYINCPGMEEGAIWRLIDASGILSEFFPDAIGVKQHTGKGNKLNKP